MSRYTYIAELCGLDLDDPAQRAVAAIISDLTDRSGLGNSFEGIDNDIQREIARTWAALVKAETKEAPAPGADCGYECHTIGGPWIAENPDCPEHGRKG